MSETSFELCFVAEEVVCQRRVRVASPRIHLPPYKPHRMISKDNQQGLRFHRMSRETHPPHLLQSTQSKECDLRPDTCSFTNANRLQEAGVAKNQNVITKGANVHVSLEDRTFPFKCRLKNWFEVVIQWHIGLVSGIEPDGRVPISRKCPLVEDKYMKERRISRPKD